MIERGHLSTTEFLTHLESFIGQPAGPAVTATDEVNLPTIRRWVEAMGDANPIYLDHDVARATGRAGTVAPPPMLSVWTSRGYRATLAERHGGGGDRSGVLDALSRAGFSVTPGTNCDQTYHRELHLGDRVSVSTVVGAVSPEKLTRLGPGHFVTLRSTFVDSLGEAVGEQDMRVFAYRPPTPDSGTASAGGSEQEMTLPALVLDGVEPVAPCAAGTRAEPLRDGVEVGDQLPAFDVAIDRCGVIACTTAVSDFRAGHYDPAVARALGWRDIFVDIPTSLAFAARFVTDWCGPRGRLRSARVRLGIPFYAGEILHLSGRVASIDGSGRVMLDIAGETGSGKHLVASIDVDLPE
jgi:acyl dehydratase